tara:strand:+ start:199 stop:312 length:114 start_codon:yes stop_codon:yes gene_type:complete
MNKLIEEYLDLSGGEFIEWWSVRSPEEKEFIIKTFDF